MITEEIKEKSAALVCQMSDIQKVRLLVGKDFWHIDGVSEFGLPSIMVTDGPHGLRKQDGQGDHLGLGDSVPSVCFPTASAMACSFDTELIKEVGEALGEECVKEGAAMLLGPGINHKRSPLCGRNFEYFSEDPYLSGKLAAAMIKGIQSKGVGACIKHFAGNNQEYMRLVADSIIDERALYEIYLKQFEIAVKEGQPAAIMAAYNRLNGVYCCENKELLEDTARKKWGFDGVFISDWGAVNDTVSSFQNGLDLEMPGPCKNSEEQILEAVAQGKFPRDRLDIAAQRTAALLLHHQTVQSEPYDSEKHLNLALRTAEESAVLLKNEGVLPLRQGASLAVIGLFARQPRYQGAGSSKVNPIALDNVCEALEEYGIDFTYAQGYDEKGGTSDILLTDAKAAAMGKDVVIILAGLPDDYESEGYDRESLDLPAGHNRLIGEIASVNPNTVVVLQCGSAVTMPWSKTVNGILLMYLSGCQGGKAAVNLLTGRVNPSGKLAETFPFSTESTPCYETYGSPQKACPYRESIFTGYRYYDTAKKSVLFPFGYGLSYTRFTYRDLNIGCRENTVTVDFMIRNTGNYAGKETVQLYISHRNPGIFKAEQELRRFLKISLMPGEEQQVRFVLSTEDFAYYNVNVHDWHTESGDYEIRIGASSGDIRLRDTVHILGDDTVPVPNYRETAPAYYCPDMLNHIPQEQFETLLGRAVPQEEKPHRPYTHNVTVGELRQDTAAFAVLKPLLSCQSADVEDELSRRRKKSEYESPIRGFIMAGVSKKDIAELMERINKS